MARKFKLRQYHESVVARLQDVAQATAAPVASRLAIEVGGEPWLVDMADVSEVLPPPVWEPVPLTQPWFCGTANIRGNLYSIVDFSAFLGGRPATGFERRVLLIHPKFSVNGALLVDRVLGLRNPEQMTRETAADVVTWIDADSRRLRQLDLAQLVVNPDFLNVGVFKRRSVFTQVAQQPA